MTAAAIPPAIAPRVGALLRLLGSDVDGEALGAARALRRTLGGVGWGSTCTPWPTRSSRAAEPATALRGRAGRQPRRGWEAGTPSPGSIELEPARRRQVVDALSRASARGALSSWEQQFVASVVATLRGTRHRLSVRQLEVVERLMSKHEGAHS